MCWVYWLFSLFGGYFITMIFIQLHREIMNKNNNDKITFVKATLYFLFLVFCLGVISSITAICYSAEGNQVAYPLVYLFSITLTFLRGVLCPNIHIEKLKETRFRYTVDPRCFVVVHYLLWMIIGAITEPFWAIPIVTSCATLTFLFYFLAFFCFSSYRNWKSGRDIENLIILVLTIFSIICVQFSYFVAGSHFFNEGLVSSIIFKVCWLSFWAFGSNFLRTLIPHQKRMKIHYMIMLAWERRTLKLSKKYLTKAFLSFKGTIPRSVNLTV